MERLVKKKKRCVMCRKRLKVFERNLCSCGKDVCLKHVQRSLHDCPLNLDKVLMEKVDAPKILKI